jgi:hypothetical protein
MAPWRQLSAKVAPFHQTSPPDKKTTAISFEGQPSHPLDVAKDFNQFLSLSHYGWRQPHSLNLYCATYQKEMCNFRSATSDRVYSLQGKKTCSLLPYIMPWKILDSKSSNYASMNRKHKSRARARVEACISVDRAYAVTAREVLSCPRILPSSNPAAFSVVLTNRFCTKNMRNLIEDIPISHKPETECRRVPRQLVDLFLTASCTTLVSH